MRDKSSHLHISHSMFGCLLLGLLSVLLKVEGFVRVGILPLYSPQPIDPGVYSNLFTYAHLIDISYCVDKFSQIGEPFECDLDCSERFPNVTLVDQWYFDDSVCGYIATTYSNIFQYNLTILSKNPKKTIIVSLRGTRSVYDSITDLKVDMTPYSNLRYSLPFCGRNCKIHSGFAEYFRNTLRAMHLSLEKELMDEPNYELVFVGHSMGGSVALLLALHYLDLGFDKMTVVTMGQPLTGNKDFTTWVDFVMESYLPVAHNTFDRKYLRVVHKDDIVTTLPRKGGNLFEKYCQFDNQIYLNVSASTTIPAPNRVVDCFSGSNPMCISGDFLNVPLGRLLTNNYVESHNTYFRYLGLCGLRV